MPLTCSCFVPRLPRDRARTSPRRSYTRQDGSNMVPRGARKSPRGIWIIENKWSKSDPKRNSLQTSFLERFGADFWGFSGGFGIVLGMILEAWRAIFLDFWSFTETAGNNTKPHEKASKRLQETSKIKFFTIVKRAEHAIQEASRWIRDGKIIPEGCNSGLLKRTALPVPLSSRFSSTVERSW